MELNWAWHGRGMAGMAGMAGAHHLSLCAGTVETNRNPFRVRVAQVSIGKFGICDRPTTYKDWFFSLSLPENLDYLLFIQFYVLLMNSLSPNSDLFYFNTGVIRNDFRGFNNLSPQVYVPPLPASIPELKVRIRTATETITADMLQTVWNELDYRVDVCRITKGAHIEHM